MGNHSANAAVPSGHSGGQVRANRDLVVTTTPQLSCELCRERKIKCDKLEPCTNCVASGAVCVPVHRLRLPRGRHARRPGRTSSPGGTAGRVRSAHAAAAVDEDLSKRIQRLEALVDSMGTDIAKADSVSQGSGGQSGSQSLNAAQHARDTSTGSSNSSEVHNPVVPRSHHFWADLVAEIHGLRNVMDSALAEGDDDIAQAPDPSQADSVDGGISVLGLSGPNNSPAIPQQFVGGHIVSELCQIYLRQVDPIIKILHRPSLSHWMLEGQRYLAYPDGHASVQALSSAVCYSAASSMTEGQCRDMFQAGKSCVVADYRRVCEAAIERSGLLATRDITVLQAFVLYLIARRSQDRTRAVSTLVAVAVRIAKSLCLHVDPDTETGRRETFFYQQMRKRLWMTICLMDLQSSVFQASETLISAAEAAPSMNMPRHINDSDFSPSTTNEVPNKEGLTDTTFALVTYHAQLIGRLLNIVERDKRSISGQDDGSGTDMESASDNGQAEWEARQQHGRRFEQDALSLLHFCDPESSTFAWFTWHGTQCFVAGMRLSALRPLQRSRAGQAPPQHKTGDTEVLRLALQVLEKAHLMHTDPRGEGYRWYITIPWPALAVSLAECYVCTDVALLRRAWPVIEACYQLHEAVIARFSGGILQGPLGKMMRQTREKVAPLLDGGVSDSSGSSFAKSWTQLSPTHSSGPDRVMRGILDDTLPTTVQSSSMLPEQMWNLAPLSLENQSVLSPGTLPLDPALDPQISDESWRMWEEFVSGISLDEFANAGMFFDENHMEG